MPEHDDHHEPFTKAVGSREDRKLRARSWADESLWFWVGMFGLVGWSVALPTVIGIGVGVWIDKRWPGPHSWTLMLMFVGLIVGCATAWFWVRRESGDIVEQPNGKNKGA